jgi:hypothetical protein
MNLALSDLRPQRRKKVHRFTTELRANLSRRRFSSKESIGGAMCHVYHKTRRRCTSDQSERQATGGLSEDRGPHKARRSNPPTALRRVRIDWEAEGIQANKPNLTQSKHPHHWAITWPLPAATATMEYFANTLH